MLSLAFLILLGTHLCFSQTTQPNILFLLVDDLGWNDVGYHGSEILTPEIDRLAGEGVKLESYYVQPLCTPSRSQLLFGRNTIYTGLQHLVIYSSQPSGHPLGDVSLAERLRDVGYSTAMVGKWHLGFFQSEYTPTYRGFDIFHGMYNGGGDHFTHDVMSLVVVGPVGYDWHLNNGTNQTVLWEEDGYYSTISSANKVIEIVEEHDTSKPLFIYLPYQAMHTPLQVPDEYLDLYPDIVNETRKYYAAMMTCIDDSIKNITAAYDRKGILNNTIIIFSTDNGGPTSGGANNTPLRGEKKTLFEGGMRGVAWVWSDMLETTQGTEVTELLQISDWFPTLVNLAGGSTDDLPLDGFDIWPTISRNEPSPRTEILHEIDPLWLPRGNNTYPDIFNTRIRASLRQGDYKIITGVPYAGVVANGPPPFEDVEDIFDLDLQMLGMDILDPEFQDVVGKDPDEPWGKNLWLFNIRDDPNEENDLSEEREDIVESMLLRLAEYYAESVNATFPWPDPSSNPNIRGGAWTPWRDSNLTEPTLH